MMKRFLTAVLGSFVGAWIALVLMSVVAVLISLAVMGSAWSSGSEFRPVGKNSVLRIDLGMNVGERDRSDLSFNSTYGYKIVSTTGLSTILKGIKAAATDDNISAIFIDCKGTTVGFASRYEIRQALADFKRSGKPVYAYGDNISQGDYFIASVADSVFLNPIGTVDIHGLQSITPYYKKMLDKVGIEMQVARVGTFKSAVEPYTLTGMSDASRLQKEHYLGNMWGVMAEAIASSRGLSVETVNAMADDITLFHTGGYFLKWNLVDSLCYRHEMIERMRRLTKVDRFDDPRFVEVGDVVASSPLYGGSSDDIIAVVYADGEIDGGGVDDIDSGALVRDIVTLANDDCVKGVVIRVNSPGGSAFGSEQIWQALEEVKAAGKPVAASMGDCAASGGYYISCGAERIFAEPVTLTGSIGIYGAVPCFQDLAEQKIGVTFSEVSTSKGGVLSMMRRLTPAQLAKLQAKVDDGYELFTSRCAQGRGMTQDSLKLIAEGRVWDGISALDNGLVDEFGTLDDAISWVAGQAGLSKYDTEAYPSTDESLARYLSTFVHAAMSERFKSQAGELFQYYDAVESVIKRDPLQCLMEPVEIK